MKKFMRTGGAASAAPPAPAKLNGHANGGTAGQRANGHARAAPDDQASTLSRRRGAGALWEDPDFPAGPRALYKHRKPPYQHIVWMRPHEMCTRPEFRAEEGGAEAEAGELGGPWLAAAAAALRLTPRLLARVVPPGQDFGDHYCGAFRFRFWQFGEWREVAVDDRLPTRRGRPLGARAPAATHFWVPLLEKAHAKLYGSYERAAAEGGVARALQDLTGGIVQSFALPAQDRHLTFQVLNSAVPRSSLLVATVSDSERRERRLRNGLVTTHAYCVTGLARVRGAAGAGDTPLVRVRDASGRGEWAGAWSRASWEWHALSARDRELLAARAADDGEFWMSFEDFARGFARLELVHVGPDDWMAEPALHARRPWRAVLARRRWRVGYNAGGGPRHAETTAMNPQFHVQIPRAAAGKCHVVVSVTQHYACAAPARLHAIGFAVYEVPPHAPRLTPRAVAEQRPLDVTNHSVAREVVTFFTLPPGDYVVVPQTARPDVDAKFLLRILTDEQTNIWEVNEDNVIVENVWATFSEELRSHPEEARALLARLFGKRPVEEVDAAGLRRALRRAEGGACARAPSAELCRALVMLRDAGASGRVAAAEVPALLRALRSWREAFRGAGGAGAGGAASAYRLRALLRAAGVGCSNKVVECLVARFARGARLSADGFATALARLHLAHERYHSLDTKLKSNPLSLEEMILMTIYS